MLETILLLSPIVIGAAIAFVDSPKLSSCDGRLKDWLSSKRESLKTEQGKISRFIVKPVISLLYLIASWTDSVSPVGLRSGSRATGYLYTVSIAGFIIFYFAVLAFIVAVALLLLWFALSAIGNEVGGGNSSSAGRFTSRAVSSLFGGTHYETRGKGGTVILQSEEKERIFGGKYVEHRNADGEKIGTSEEKETLFGGTITEHRDAEGKVVGTSEKKKSLLGGEYTETRRES